MNLFSTFILAFSILILSVSSGFSQISKSTFKGVIDKNGPIFEMQKANSGEQISAGVGEILLSRQASFKNINPESNLLKVPTLVLELVIKSIDSNELILEGHTYSPNVPENILLQRYNIPLPLTENNVVEVELLPTMKFVYRKVKSFKNVFPTLDLKIVSVSDENITAEITREPETWGFGIDAFRNTLIFENKNHNYYEVPGYKIELEE
ncbi:MAG: hypothetical protein KDF58_09745 [Alphaproteobacteria bacterium]|nr:hypothetical protein [Alphaproteobacteria bacterium]HPF47327.1 hypothetical protein [Emcibacteraceae bacterium]